MKQKSALSSSSLVALCLVGSLTACKALKDALKTGATESYCESLCDWAVDCAITERPWEDEGEMAANCLDATHDANGDCSSAEDGSIGPDGRVLLSTCIDGVDALTCDKIAGDLTDMSPGDFVPPVKCLPIETGTTQSNTYNAARGAVMESGDALCERVEESFCDLITDCVIDKGAPADKRNDINDKCSEYIFDSITSDCTDTNKYAAELLDINLDREAARKCVAGLEEESTCSIISAGFLTSTTGAACAVGVSGIDDLVTGVDDLLADFL